MEGEKIKIWGEEIEILGKRSKFGGKSKFGRKDWDLGGIEIWEKIWDLGGENKFGGKI